MEIGAIIQARMSSQRLPNKVLHEVAGKPVLQYLLERLYHCDCLDKIVVATSVDDSDTPIADFCQRENVDFYRGPLADVAGRFDEVLGKYGFDAFIRVNGDSPLLDQRLVEKGVDLFLGGNYDLVTNVLPRTYPKGQSVEVLSTATYRKTYPRMQEAEEKEHVTLYFHKHPEEFRIKNFALPENLNHIQLSVDTWQDMNNFVTIVSKMTRSHWEYKLEDILGIYRSLKLPEG
jgi:spore coat polysaccharide biosynthesis protein SpsF